MKTRLLKSFKTSEKFQVKGLGTKREISEEGKERNIEWYKEYITLEGVDGRIVGFKEMKAFCLLLRA